MQVCGEGVWQLDTDSAPDRRAQVCCCAVLLFLLSGCTADLVLPPSLDQQLDHTVTFITLREHPDAYRGRLIALGGKVLHATRLKDRTEIEVLHLPLNNVHLPRASLTETQGRFLAFQKEFLDPALFPDGTRVTLVGEVSGATVKALGEMSYSYPTLEIKYLKIWEVVRPYSWPGRHPWGFPFPAPASSEGEHRGRIF
ncbi:MAG TPA: Slp family lipoprotein [Nitrospiraceae bacterium]|nr:Slp family lipoprotein [Nitrospiraceae bacterium]